MIKLNAILVFLGREPKEGEGPVNVRVPDFDATFIDFDTLVVLWECLINMLGDLSYKSYHSKANNNSVQFYLLSNLIFLKVSFHLYYACLYHIPCQASFRW